MKGKRITFPLLVISATSALLAAESVNIIKNGSFEYSSEYASPTTGWASGLEVQAGDAAATWEIDSTSGTAKDGKNFFRAKVTSVSDQNWHVQIKDPTWAAKKGYIYHFSLWARADEEKSAQISVYGNQDSKFTYRTSSMISLTTEWKQYHQMFISDAEGAGLINFAVVVGFAPGVYDIDNVVITEDPNTAGTMYANGDFEADGAGWSLYVQSTSDPVPEATVSYPEDGAKSGKKFCRIDVKTAPDSSWKIQLQDGSWTTELEGVYTFKFWAKSDAEDAKVHVAVQAGSSRDYSYLEGGDIILSNEWAEYSYDYVATDISGPDSVSFNIYCGFAAGKYDFDNITLSKLPGSSVINPSITKKNLSPIAIRTLPGQLQCILNKNTFVNKIQINDIQGRLFYSEVLNKVVNNNYNLPRPPSGTYILRINSDHSVQNQRIVLP